MALDETEETVEGSVCCIVLKLPVWLVLTMAADTQANVTNANAVAETSRNTPAETIEVWLEKLHKGVIN
ncbi:hypothetical protein RvY_08353 [Ramazzottius varieornatus]|uniref:Uncharacterized protein n=1 Tax=Ramazzottius varieornatus TaxID=947166 RepID=A0A1D1V7V7_RAMVA|nr:hypothetical protein RvY_08353 [Ramazzottius varieornatus]